ncbi:hypothetical protein [Bacteroides reticulotermitis]|uniref:hypothetical protein n=1 Tax=Bacteroides reticulotermitis TaxID=1133319 RepID=UPI001FCC81E1|nr:hypothetical protein [Bacteroides reticulotermitis]
MKTNWIFIFVLLALLPVILLRDYTPSNELRYLSIADEAIRNGTWVTFTNHGIPYADKPPLYLWIIMQANIYSANTRCGFFRSFRSYRHSLSWVRWIAGQLPKQTEAIALRGSYSC